MAKFCGKCGTPTGGGKFCPKCGTPIFAEVQDENASGSATQTDVFAPTTSEQPSFTYNNFSTIDNFSPINNDNSKEKYFPFFRAVLFGLTFLCILFVAFLYTVFCSAFALKFYETAQIQSFKPYYLSAYFLIGSLGIIATLFMLASFLHKQKYIIGDICMKLLLLLSIAFPTIKLVLLENSTSNDFFFAINRISEIYTAFGWAYIIIALVVSNIAIVFLRKVAKSD